MTASLNICQENICQGNLAMELIETLHSKVLKSLFSYWYPGQPSPQGKFNHFFAFPL